MSFAYPFFWLIFALFVLAWWWLKNTRTRIFVPHLPLIQKQRKSSWLTFLQFAGIACIVGALSKPLLETKHILMPITQSQIALVLDTSFSMEAVDFSHTGENRLEVLKRLSKDFIDNNPYDSILIVAFGEHTIILNVLTQDREFLHHIIDSLTLGLAGGKTAINDALARTIYTLIEFDDTQDFQNFVDTTLSNDIKRSIILLTDGFDTHSKMSTAQTIDLAIKTGVRIYPVNISDGGDSQSLEFIAKASGGKAFSALNETDLAKIYQQIGEITPHTIFKPYGYDISVFVLGLGILLLGIWWVRYYGLSIKRR